jgi:hypothetical protein
LPHSDKLSTSDLRAQAKRFIEMTVVENDRPLTYSAAIACKL